MKSRFLRLPRLSSKSFTLIELIVVIIIVGILAAVGITQYSTIVEKSRIAEAKIRIGTMRQLAHEYWLNNGTLATVANADVGTDGQCSSTNYYRYTIGDQGVNRCSLNAYRCGATGKPPVASRNYVIFMMYYPDTGVSTWCCQWSDDQTACFGLPNTG